MNKWNFESIYKDYSAWEIDFTSLEEKIKELTTYNGKLNSYEDFKTFMLEKSKAEMRLEKLFLYASCNHDLNQKDVTNSTYYSRIYSLYNQYIEAVSFLEPQLISLGDTVKEYVSNEELKQFNFEIKKLFDSQKYILDDKSEAIIASYNQATSTYSSLYSNLNTVDKAPSVDVKISDGSVIKVNVSNYTFYLGKLKNVKDRKKVFEAIYKYYDAHKETLAGIYKGIMQTEAANQKIRGYSSILESHLKPRNIDTKVFMSLINTARKNNKPLKRYYKLRKEYFGLSTLHTYDRFLSFKDSKVEYSYDKVKEMVLEATKALGDDYYNHACEALKDGRVDVYPGDGKRTGAYSAGLYEEGPFILLNHNKTLNDAFTVAHEGGHSIHTLYANENQPYETANYEIFVAEVASTFNEQVFLDYLIKNTTDKDELIVILQESIDGLIATFYRQALFANFEYLAHKLVEDNKVVNSEALSNIMIDLYKDYYGINIKKEKYKELVWAYIPHMFASPYYVYQYATSYSASLAIYENVKNNVPGAFDSYLNMLKAGGSNYPIDVVKLAGIDLTNDKPFKAVINRLDELVTKLEELLK